MRLGGLALACSSQVRIIGLGQKFFHATEAETIKNSVATTHVLVNTSETKVRLSKVIDCAKYSSFNKLLHVTAYVLKFLESLQKPQSQCRSPS